MTSNDLAWRSGYRANEIGFPYLSCPFAKGSPNRRKWLAGWTYAEKGRRGLTTYQRLTKEGAK